MCYCVTGGGGEYNGQVSALANSDGKDKATSKCEEDAKDSGQTCGAWMCHVTDD